MSDRPNRRAFAARPGDHEQWIRSAEAAQRGGKPSGFTAFQRGVTVADMLRDLLAREFPKDEGDPS